MPIPASRKQLWLALSKVTDPEIPVVNVVEMGIVRDVQVQGQRAIITMTPTFSGCPALNVIRDSLEQTAIQEGFSEVEVKTVLSPAWTTDWITPEAKVKLERYGIAPPKPKRDGDLFLIQLELSPTRCPKCSSLNTSIKNTFGSTLCKSIHYCNDCHEPFESFKAL